MQEKVKAILQKKFPTANVREETKSLKMNVSQLNGNDLNSLSLIEGMYKSILIKRSGTRLVIILLF